MSKDKKHLIMTGTSKINSRIWVVDIKNNNLNKAWEGRGKVYLNHI